MSNAMVQGFLTRGTPNTAARGVGADTFSDRAIGSYHDSRDVWVNIQELLRRIPPVAVVVADRRVLRLHPTLSRGLSRRAGLQLLPVHAGESLKQLSTMELWAKRCAGVPRGTPIVAIGGGTVGDAATVFAHLLKRGSPLVQVPTTLLAAADSSIGGKGAVNVGRVKNGLGVFHYPEATWLCPDLWRTLNDSARREGLAEAMKMAVCLDASAWQVFEGARLGAAEAWVKLARNLKRQVCAADPYELSGVRSGLNFGHTFGHLIESLSGFRVRHGLAVGLGMVCALDVGCSLGVTSAKLAQEVEAVVDAQLFSGRARANLRRVFSRTSVTRVRQLLQSDKKHSNGVLRMVLLKGKGRWVLQPVAPTEWKGCFQRWTT